MTPLLLVTRPESEFARTQVAAAAAGFATLSMPLLQFEPLAWGLPQDDFDSLLFTSAQAPRHAAPRLAALAHYPVHAVGQATATAAVACGFALAAIGSGDASAAAATAAAAGCRHMLHLSGEDVAPMQVPPALRITRVALYRAELAAHFPDAGRAALAEGRPFAVLLYSARTAAHFATLVDKHGLARGGIRLVALSPAVAAAAGSGWAAVASAFSPTTDALLAAAQTLWQSEPHG